MPVRRIKRMEPSGRQFSRFGGSMHLMGGMKRRVGRRVLKPLPYGLMLQGAGRRVRRRRMGRGFLDTLKNIGSKALGIARSVPIASTALGLMGPKAAPAAAIARTLGFGRVRRVMRRRRMGGRKRRPARRVGRGLLSSILGMTGLGRKRRVRRRMGARKRRPARRVGRGLLSSLLGMTGLGRKRRVRRRMGGAVRRRRYVR
jgi:hypothetical protein